MGIYTELCHKQEFATDEIKRILSGTIDKWVVDNYKHLLALFNALKKHSHTADNPFETKKSILWYAEKDEDIIIAVAQQGNYTANFIFIIGKLIEHHAEFANDIKLNAKRVRCYQFFKEAKSEYLNQTYTRYDAIVNPPIEFSDCFGDNKHIHRPTYEYLIENYDKRPTALFYPEIIDTEMDLDRNRIATVLCLNETNKHCLHTMNKFIVAVEEIYTGLMYLEHENKLEEQSCQNIT